MTKEEAIKYLQQLYPNGGHCWLDEQRIEAIGVAVKALQEEPVNEELEEVIDNALVFEEKTFVYDDPETKEGMEEVYTREQTIEIFVAGAQWQKERLISKACEWLEENYDSCDYMPNDYGEYYGKDKFIEHFRKAMEDNELKK